jgi:hypothetical protein
VGVVVTAVLPLLLLLLLLAATAAVCARSAAPRIHGCASASAHVMRCSGSTSIICAMRSTAPREALSIGAYRPPTMRRMIVPIGALREPKGRRPLSAK